MIFHIKDKEMMMVALSDVKIIKKDGRIKMMVEIGVKTHKTIIIKINLKIMGGEMQLADGEIIIKIQTFKRMIIIKLVMLGEIMMLKTMNLMDGIENNLN